VDICTLVCKCVTSAANLDDKCVSEYMKRIMIVNGRLPLLLIAIVIYFKEIMSSSVWCKEHFWNLCVLQVVYLSNLF
jgi:hypothetical protein